MPEEQRLLWIEALEFTSAILKSENGQGYGLLAQALDEIQEYLTDLATPS